MKTNQKNSERQVTKIFQDVFDKYDLMNDLMSLGVHRLMQKKLLSMIVIAKNSIAIKQQVK